MWPQLAVIALTFIGVGMNLAKHGEARGEYNFWHSLIANLIMLWVFYAGGFFDGFF